MTEPHIVSNSEANAWQECQMKYFFAYDLGLKPIDERIGKALRIGILGHELLSVYFDVLKDDLGPDRFNNAQQVALNTLAIRMSKAELVQTLEVYGILSRILSRYFLYFSKEHPHARIHEIETAHKQELTDEFSYGLRLDLLWSDGPWNYLTDHKFTYDFWNQTKLDTKGSGQTSKYFAVLKIKGYDVDKAMINQIRYRDRKSKPYEDNEMFRESAWTPTAAEQRNVLIEQVKLSRQIINHRKLPIEERRQSVTRSLGSAACDFCDFASICVASLRGEEIESDIETFFEKNTYGYNKQAMEPA